MINSPKIFNLFLTGEISLESEPVQKLITELIELNCKKEYNLINLYINSRGGDLTQSLVLYDLIRSSAVQINTINVGDCDSGALIIFLAGKERFTFESSFFLYHSLSHEICGMYSMLEESMAVTKSLQERMERVMLERTHFTQEELDEIKSKKSDCCIIGEESLAKGISTKMIGSYGQ